MYHNLHYGSISGSNVSFGTITGVDNKSFCRAVATENFAVGTANDGKSVDSPLPHADAARLDGLETPCAYLLVAHTKLCS